ncbi:MAG: 50S ribosome-binding GTPase, partial [Elusimicrobia bacterium]|nr:50S ribosome-binding GTPase [Elusimicrobiota bacterium]
VRLDHPEEDLPPLPADAAIVALDDAAGRLQTLLCGYARGRARRAGARVGLFGRPNAGKSSLLNALLGRDRAIIAPAPGTTRDLLEEEAELSGVTVTLIDTAGLRADASDPAEREGIARAESALDTCEVAVLVVDAARPVDGEDLRAQAAVADSARRRGARVIVAHNKTDLVQDRARRHDRPDALACSALTGEGLSELEAAIAAAAGAFPADEGESLLDDARQRDALAVALAELEAAREEIQGRPGAWEDRAADRLRRALARLGEASGVDASESVLDEIFSRFCIGK